MVPNSDILGLLIATLGGAAIGLERQWSGHADGPRARLGGLRTFTMLGALAGLSGWLWTLGFSAAATALLVGAIIIVGVAYATASRYEVDATTEIAALLVLAAGVLAGIGYHRLASAIVALESLILVEKSRLHALVKRVDETELRAGVRFAVMALVILPILPAGPYGPLGGIRPRELWALVLFFSGLSFLGFLARRIIGPGQGYLVTGLLGGVMSSTNTTLTFARLSRTKRSFEREIALGAVGANAVLYPRVLIATAVLNRAMAWPLASYLAIPALIAAAVTALGALRPAVKQAQDKADRNPLQLLAALQMAALFQLVVMIVEVARQRGPSAVLTSAAVLGLTDVDALTMSMARAPHLTVEVAALAVAVGVAANTLLKLGVSIFLGSARFRVIAGGTLAVMLVSTLAIILL
ncbi:MAG: DUF4010 domain-containing protein [Vicinamibacterales bacterium]|nr:DUF4010 domain-containing protein [Vicinamibacterales bacterium]